MPEERTSTTPSTPPEAPPLPIPVPGGLEKPMADQPNLVDAGNLTVALTGMANEFGASAGRRTQRADQLAGDSAAMWAVALTSPTVMAGMGQRAAFESGAGRTRVEANTPAGSQTTGG